MWAQPSTILGTLIQHHPEVIDTLKWYGIEAGEDTLRLTLSELCGHRDLELIDVLTDIRAMVDDDFDDFNDDDDDEIEDLVDEN